MGGVSVAGWWLLRLWLWRWCQALTGTLRSWTHSVALACCARRWPDQPQNCIMNALSPWLQGRDAGELKLRMVYVPLPKCNPMVGDYGALFVYVRKGRDFPRMIPKVEHSCNPYFVGKVGDKEEKSAVVQNSTVRAYHDSYSPHFTCQFLSLGVAALPTCACHCLLSGLHLALHTDLRLMQCHCAGARVGQPESLLLQHPQHRGAAAQLQEQEHRPRRGR